MVQSDELKKIKRIYGEKFSRLCRELFPQILEQEGTLLKILQGRFSRNCNTLCESIEENGLKEDLKDLIYTAFDDDREEDKKEDSRTPYEILDEAGYELHECLTEEDIQEYRKYYKENEVLCTIYNGGRLNSRVCFWAVKKDVDQIEREDFEYPKKDDEYSTSVLAIQFDKQPKSRVEIISRYNHTVPNPNCTLNNNLDNIAEGLQESFAKLLEERGYSLNAKETKEFEIPGYTLASDGKYYKYNLEIDGKYYCPGNIVIGEGGIAREIGNPEEVILCDYFKIDLKNKTVDSLIGNLKVDSFVDDLTDIEKIEVKKDKEKGKGKRSIIIYRRKMDDKTDSPEPIVIELDHDNQIVGYTNKELQNIGDNFLLHNKALAELNLPQVQSIGSEFLCCNEALANLSLPQVQSIEDNFLWNNRALTKLSLPQVQSIGGKFLYRNKALTELNLPQVQSIGSEFLCCDEALAKLSLPQVQSIEDNFLTYNEALTEVSLPQVQSIGNNFLYKNKALTEVNLPQIQSIGSNFLPENKALTEVNLPQIQSIGWNFLYENKALTEVSMPQVLEIGNKFLENNATFAEMFRRGGAEAIREYSARAKQENITPENALRCALSQGITTEQVNQANKIEQEQTKENINKGESIDDK